MRGGKAKLFGHMAQAGAARVIVAALILAALVAAVWKGPATGVAIGLAAGLFYLARPGPDDDLDRFTGRE